MLCRTRAVKVWHSGRKYYISRHVSKLTEFLHKKQREQRQIFSFAKPKTLCPWRGNNCSGIFAAPKMADKGYIKVRTERENISFQSLMVNMYTNEYYIWRIWLFAYLFEVCVFMCKSVNRLNVRTWYARERIYISLKTKSTWISPGVCICLNHA